VNDFRFSALYLNNRGGEPELKHKFSRQGISFCGGIIRYLCCQLKKAGNILARPTGLDPVCGLRQKKILQITMQTHAH